MFRIDIENQGELETIKVLVSGNVMDGDVICQESYSALIELTLEP